MNSAEFHRERVIIGDAEYHITVGGQGDPVPLLHGFPQTSLCWEQVAAQLMTEHCIVMPDLRGYANPVRQRAVITARGTASARWPMSSSS